MNSPRLSNRGRDFNTSHVKVLLGLFDLLETGKYNFNTSHVKVLLLSQLSVSKRHLNFNTSHVKVLRIFYRILLSLLLISIHLMLRFYFVCVGYS